MLNDIIRVPISTATKESTVTIKIPGLKTFRARMWVATLIIRFAAWVMPLKTTVEYVDGDDDQTEREEYGLSDEGAEMVNRFWSKYPIVTRPDPAE